MALVYPPVADATQPYSSLPALAGFLRAHEHHEPVLHDANLAYVEQVLTAPHVAAAAATLTEDNPLSSALLKAPFVCDDIDDAVADLRTRETFMDLGRLGYARRVVQDAWEILNETELRAGANPLAGFFESISLPWLQSVAPGALGISITYRSQILPAITLARMVKERMPALPVIVGGHIVSLWWPALPRAPQVFDWCDYFIAFEGESALEKLLTALECGTSIDDVPNLAYRKDGQIRRSALHVENIDDLPAPDYRGLPLDRYLAPEPVLLLNTSRGCYWSKCEFCSVSPSMRQQFRMRRPELVLGDIETLQARHGARCISFGDDCIAPRMLHALARGIRERGLKLAWQCEVRFEKQLDSSLLGELRGAGCRNLIFGLESYAPRVLDAMNKGVEHDQIRRILSDCRDAGIAFNLQLFFGFPGETADEARQTFDFVMEQLRGSVSVSAGTFQLQPGSGVARDPKAFGIRIPRDQEPLAVEIDYEPHAPHAEAMRSELRSTILSRAPFGCQPLGIDALALLFLHHANGSTRMTAPVARQTDAALLKRGCHQTISEGNVLYDYDLDRAVELSDLAVWLLDRLDEPQTAADLARELDEAADEPGGETLFVVRQITESLLDRGFLRNDDAALAR
ncbi:MAG TPA: radical SAM protein [Thermoanaerobaculia bacterium]